MATSGRTSTLAHCAAIRPKRRLHTWCSFRIRRNTREAIFCSRTVCCQKARARDRRIQVSVFSARSCLPAASPENFRCCHCCAGRSPSARSAVNCTQAAGTTSARPKDFLRWMRSCRVRPGFLRESNMKKLVVVAVVVVLLLVLTPLGIGRIAANRFDHGLDVLVENAPYLRIVERKSTVGWYKSEQLVTFEVFEPWLRAM